MITPKQFGKAAKQTGINAPTLDENFSSWLLHNTFDRAPDIKKDYLVQWWEGWYEALDESLAMPKKIFRSAAACH